MNYLSVFIRMGATSALFSAGNALRRNPIILAGIVPLTIVNALRNSAYFAGVLPYPPFRSYVVLTIVWILIVPFFDGGIYGMAQEALDGPTRLETFRHEARDNYVRLLFGSLLKIAISVAAAIIGSIVLLVFLFVVFLFVGVALGRPTLQVGLGGGGAIGIFLLLPLILLLLGYLSTLPVIFFIQFYSAAIVVSDTPVSEGFRKSVRLVRNALASTLGYSLLYVMIGLLDTVPFWYFTVAHGNPTGLNSVPASVPSVPLDELLSGSLMLLTVVVSIVVGAFLRTYRISYYVTLIETE